MRYLAGPSCTCHVQTARTQLYMCCAVVLLLRGLLREHFAQSQHSVGGAMLVLPLPRALLLHQYTHCKVAR